MGNNRYRKDKDIESYELSNVFIFFNFLTRIEKLDKLVLETI